MTDAYVPDMSEYAGDTNDVHGTMNYGDPDDERRAYLRQMNRSQGRVCRYPGCDEVITNGAQVCQLHAIAWRMVKGQVARLLARKAMWDQARDAVLEEFNTDRIVAAAERMAQCTE